MQTITNVIEVATVYLANSASGPPEVASMRALPNPGAAWDAPRTSTSREPCLHFRIRLYTGKYNKEHLFPVPVFEKSTRKLGGHTEENLGFV